MDRTRHPAAELGEHRGGRAVNANALDQEDGRDAAEIEPAEVVRVGPVDCGGLKHVGAEGDERVAGGGRWGGRVEPAGGDLRVFEPLRGGLVGPNGGEPGDLERLGGGFWRAEFEEEPAREGFGAEQDGVIAQEVVGPIDCGGIEPELEPGEAIIAEYGWGPTYQGCGKKD